MHGYTYVFLFLPRLGLRGVGGGAVYISQVDISLQVDNDQEKAQLERNTYKTF